MSDTKYTARAMAEDIVGSMRAFWEEFAMGSVVVESATGDATAIITSTDNEVFQIRVRKFSD